MNQRPEHLAAEVWIRPITPAEPVKPAGHGFGLDDKRGLHLRAVYLLAQGRAVCFGFFQ